MLQELWPLQTLTIQSNPESHFHCPYWLLSACWDFTLACSDSHFFCICHSSEWLRSHLYCCNDQAGTNIFHILEDPVVIFLLHSVCLQCFATFWEVGECGSSWDKTTCKGTLCVSVWANTCRQNNNKWPAVPLFAQDFCFYSTVLLSWTLGTYPLSDEWFCVEVGGCNF